METDFSIERPRIPKLTGPNYRPWSLQVKRLLQSLELWTVVVLGPQEDPVPTAGPGIGREELGISSKEVAVGTGSTDSTGGPKGQGDRSALKDAKAATLIMGVCSQHVIQHILLLETAKEQWETLQKLLHHRGNSSRNRGLFYPTLL